MLALILEDGTLSLQDVPRPACPPGFSLVAMQACGICGSDLRYWAGDNPWALQTLGEARPNPPRMVLGHELSGSVAGDPAAPPQGILCFRTCGVCYACRHGRENLCPDVQHLGHGAGWDPDQLNPGGFAELCPVWTDKLYPLPAGVGAVEATLLDALGVAVHAVRRAGISPGAGVLILGAGPVGLLILQVAAALGAGRMVVSDPSPTAREVAAALGAHETLDPAALSSGDLDRAVRDTLGPAGAEVVFEASGRPAARELGWQVLAPGGRMVLLAATEDLAVPQRSLAGERSLTTSANFAYAEFQMALDLLGAGRISTGPLVTHTFPLSEAPRAFEIAAHKEDHGALKVVVTCAS